MIKSPDRLVPNKKGMNSTSMINSFIGKNKSLENENHKNGKFEKVKSNKNIKNNKNNNKINNVKVFEKKQKAKKINNSNTISNNIINNTNINSKIISSQKINGINTYIGISPPRENYNNINKFQINKNTLISLDQNELNDDFNKNKFIEEQKPLNIINYIAKKLVSSSFCRSFNLKYGSTKKFTSGRMPSATTTTNNYIISNGIYNGDSNPINEEIEYLNENNDNFINNNEEIDKDKNDLLDNNYYFKNLISILNQKFKKYALNYENQ